MLRYGLNKFSRYSIFATLSHSSWKFCDVDYLTFIAWAHYFLWAFTVTYCFQFFTFFCSDGGHFYTNLLQSINLFLGAWRDYHSYPPFLVMHCCFTMGFLVVWSISIVKDILFLSFFAESDSSEFLDLSDKTFVVFNTLFEVLFYSMSPLDEIPTLTILVSLRFQINLYPPNFIL